VAELYTRLFVESVCSEATLHGRIAQTNNVDVRLYDLYVSENPYANTGGADAEHDEFPCTVEVVGDSDTSSVAEYLRIVGVVMEALHQGGSKVVAACDWEEQLPGRGKLGM
jgi:hypothetical protein